MPSPIGEIIEANSTSFVAGTYRLLDASPFGALVRADRYDGCAVYALVYDVHTASRELGGHAVVRGRNGMYDHAIYAENPDLQVVLQTEVSCTDRWFCRETERHSGEDPYHLLSSLLHKL